MSMDEAPSLSEGERRDFPARLQALAETCSFIEDFCVRHGVPRADALRLTLVVEELVTNTVMHGYRRECDSPIALHLVRTPRAVRVLYEDSAPPFDLRPAIARAHAPLAETLEARAAGGLGVRLVGQLTHEARYAYEGGRNRVWLALVCKARGNAKRAGAS